MLSLLARYTQGTLTLATFHAEFAPLAWDAESGEDERAEDLAYDVMLRVAEYTQGQWDEPALHALLDAILAAQRAPASAN